MARKQTGARGAYVRERPNGGGDAIGVTVEIHSTGSGRLCHYSGEPWFPGIQTGTTWKAKVDCPVGGLDYFNPTY
jgi:hypothetical protein